MKNKYLGIAEDGEERLREAIEAQLRQERKDELTVATEYWQKVALEVKIQREIKERVKRVASPYSLWSQK
jgi:hypothetical protein